MKNWPMRLSACLAVLLLPVLACSVEVNTTSQPPASQTPQGVGTITALALTLQAVPPISATVEPTVQGTITVTLPPPPPPEATLTFTPLPLTVSVSVETNCRSGPGTVFPVLAVLHPGETAEVVGVSMYHDNYIIKNPDGAGTCWLWGQYAALAGDPATLPTVVPPATPTPAASFDLAFIEMVNCPAAYHSFNFLITNTGSVTWESNNVSLTVISDPTKTTDISLNSFARKSDNCGPELNITGSIAPGVTGYAYYNTPASWWDPIRAVVRVCSQDDLGGICLEKSLTVTP